MDDWTRWTLMSFPAVAAALLIGYPVYVAVRKAAKLFGLWRITRLGD